MRKVDLGTICIHGWRAINGSLTPLSEGDCEQAAEASATLSKLAESENAENLAPGKYKGMSTEQCNCCESKHYGERWPLYGTTQY